MSNVDICTCGHKSDKHWDLDEDADKFYNDGTGSCQVALTRSVVHLCACCSSDVKDFCQCKRFKPDNLKYLEMESEKQS